MVQMEDQFIPSPLQRAVHFGIADIDAGNFRSFDNPKALGQYFHELAADIIGHGKTAPSVRDATGTQD